jgi:hypothetical protein
MVNKKMNFFELIFYSIAKPNRYYRLTKTSNGRMIGFVFLLSLITTFFTMLPAFQFVLGNNGFYNEIKENVPYFEFKNGELYVNETYQFNNGSEYILIDTNVDYFDVSQVNKSYSSVILISRNNLITYQSYRVQEIDFSNFGDLYFNRDILYTLKPMLIIIIMVATVFVYLFQAGFYFLAALLYSLVGLIVSSATNMNLPYRILYKTAIFSKVTIALLYLLLGPIKQSVPGYATTIFAIIVTSIYVIFGVLSHRSRDAFAEAGYPMNPNNLNGNNYGNPYNNPYRNPNGNNNPNGYNQPMNPPNGYYQPGNHPTGYQQPGNNQPGYYPTGYQQPGNNQPGYNTTGYHQPGNNQSGFNQTGNDRNSHDTNYNNPENQPNSFSTNYNFNQTEIKQDDSGIDKPEDKHDTEINHPISSDDENNENY